MAKKTVNIGTSVNKGNGDPLRTAFGKINDNFDELYSALGNDGDLFDPSSVDQSLVPTTTNTVDLGSASKQWRSLYVSNNTIYIGGVAIGVDGNGNLTAGGTTVGSTPAWANITGKPTFATVATSGAYADLTDKPTLFDGAYSSLSGQPTLFSGSYADLTNKPNLAGTYQFSVAADDSTQRVISTDEVIKFIGAGGITTASDAEGNITISKTSELVSATVPTVGSTASAGEAGITYSNKIAIFTEGAFTVGVWTDVQPGWTVTDNNGFTDTIASRGGFGAASFVTTVNNWPAPASGKTYVFTSPGYQLGYTNPIEITVGNNDWTFDNNGSLTLPIGVSIDSSVSALYPKIIADSGKLFSVQGQGSTGSAALAWSLNPNTDTQYAAVGVNKGGGDDLAKVVLTAGNTTATLKVWKFDQTGAFTFPDGTIQTTAAAPAFSFSVAADDSTQRVISNNELIKFIGAGGITTASDAEGNITITGSGGSVSSLVNGAYTVSLGSTGTLTVPANGIITAPINQEFQLQAKDANSVLRNEINLDPNNGTYMSVWRDGTTSFSTGAGSWATASWNNEGGLGAARFTDAQALQDFWLTGIGSIEGVAIEASINGGARTPNVFYDDNNGEQYGVFLGLDAVPPGGQGTTVPITSLVFYYRLQSKINMDVTGGGEILVDAQAMDIDLRTTLNLDLRAGENLNLRGLGQYPVRIYTDNSAHMWEFDTAGSLTLPSEGKINGIGAPNDRYGYMSWTGNSSGDGQGYNTMRLVPDLQGLEAADTYIILDPAYDGQTGNIHIRAGGTLDNSLANLCLGGANSQVKIGAGANPPVTVKANNNSWIFGTDGDLTVPGDIRSEGAINIDINLSDSTLRRWRFGEDGDLTLPEDAVVKTTSGHLTIKGQNNVYIDSATNGQIEIGRSSGVGAVSLGSKSRGTNVVVDDLQVANGVYEFFSSLADATGVVTHNCANGHIFYHTSPDANWTVNLTNLLDTWNRATSVTIIIAQGATGYYPSAVQIAGVAQTIKWQGNATPTPSTNRTDVVTFSIINVSGTYTVLGQLTGF